MSSFNRAQIMGNLGADPVITNTGAGVRCARFRVATGGKFVDKTGNTRDSTEWHRVVVFHEPTIEFVEKHFHKGSPVFVEGRLHTRKWTDKNGTTHYITEIVVPHYQPYGVLSPTSARRDYRPNDADEPVADTATSDDDLVVF